MDAILATGLPILALALALAPRLWARLLLSRAKHRSLAGHARLSRVVAQLVPYYRYDERRAFCVDGAPVAVARSRRLAAAIAIRRSSMPRRLSAAGSRSRRCASSQVRAVCPS